MRQLGRWSRSSPTMYLESSLTCSQKPLKPVNSFLSYLHSVLIFFHLSMSSKWPESFPTKISIGTWHLACNYQSAWHHVRADPSPVTILESHELVYALLVSHCVPYARPFDQSNNWWHELIIIKLLLKHFSQSPLYFLSLGTKYSLPHTIFWYVTNLQKCNNVTLFQ